MSKAKNSGAKKTNAPAKTPVMETPVVAPQPQVDVTTEVKPLGRPANPNSVRQQQMMARQAAIEAGNAPKRGRKPVEGSARQIRMAELAEKRAAGLLTGKKGRPVIPGSKHQLAMAAKQASIEANDGKPRKQGRPKYTEEQKAAAAKLKAAKKAAAKVTAPVVEVPAES